VSCVIAYRTASPENGGAEAAALLPWSFGAQAIALFGATMILLLAPKVLSILDLRRRPAEIAAFGGGLKIGLSIFAETITFTFIAPILMLFHTKFVVLTLCRRTISWGSQRRGSAGAAAAWREAVSAHLGQTLFGIALAVFVARLSPALAWWMSPLLAGLILSIPLSFLTGSVSLGERFRRWGIFATPEETQPAPELQRFTAILSTVRGGRVPAAELENGYGLLQAVLDPFVNAVHVSLLRSRDQAPEPMERRLVELRARLLREGPDVMNAQDRVALLSDADSMATLHEELWATPSPQLAEWWRRALAHYEVVGQAPATAFRR
ncbi:MAG: glucans biosynthesis glucosyltransferase MdoH, partial [Verrucomicrobiota bacterium]